MLHKFMILFLAVLLPVQFNLKTLVEIKSAYGDDDAPQRRTFDGNKQNAGDAVIKNSNALGVKGSDAPEPLKQIIKSVPLDQGMLIQTERWGSMAVMIAIALTAFAALNTCQGFSIDLLIFGAGALIYLGGEAITTFMYQGINHMEIDISKERGKTTRDDNQIAALEDQKKSYQAAIAVTKIKEMYQLAAAAAFYTAAVVSAVLSYQLLSGYYTCLASTVASTAALGTGCVAAGALECPTTTPCITAAAADAAALGATGGAGYASAYATCTATIATECSTCAASMSTFGGRLIADQAQIVTVGPSTDKANPIMDIKTGALQMHQACITAASTSAGIHVCPVAGNVATAMAVNAKQMALAETQKAIEGAKNSALRLATVPLIGSFLEAKAQKEAQESQAKALQAAESTQQALDSTESAAAGLGIAHAPVISSKTMEACEAASFMTSEQFIGCPGSVSIPGFASNTPGELKKNNPWFKFLMDDVYAQTATDDANVEKGSTIFGFVFMGIAIVAGLITKGFFSFFNVYLGLPYARVILFGIVGSASLATAAVSYSIEKTLEENVKSIDAILTGANDPKISTMSVVTSIPYNDVSMEAINPDLFKKAKLAGEQKFPCLRGDGKGNCIENQSIVNAELAGLGIDSETLAAAGLSTRNADSMSGQSSVGRSTFQDSSSLAAMARKMRKKSVDFRNLLNNKLAQSRLSPIDFEDHERKFAGLVTKTLQDVGAKNPNLFASISEGLKKNEGAEDKAGGKSNLEKEYSGMIKKSSAPNISDAQLDGLLNANYEYQGQTQDQELAKLTQENSYEIPKNDIVENNSEDIFKMISIRYIKSAYPIFFKEDKVQAKKKK